MIGFLRRPLAALLCSLFASPLLSQTTASSDPDSVLKLRQSHSFTPQTGDTLVGATRLGLTPPIKLGKNEPAPTFITADDLKGRTDDVAEATGNVELRRAGTTLYADRLTYQPIDDEVDATGKVRVLQEGAEIDTPHLRMKLAEQIGFAETADYRISREVESEVYHRQKIIKRIASSNAEPTNAPMMLNVPDSYGLPTGSAGSRTVEATGYADRINFEGENHIRLQNATYSTCKPGNSDWLLKGREIYLDYDLNAGEADDVSLWFKDVPLLFSPYASFSLQNQRRSGMLHPTFGSSTRTGFELSLPYYWNIAPDYDATFYPRMMSRRGLQLGAEVRTFGYYHEGKADLEYLPQDQISKENRFAVRLQHKQNLGQGLNTQINFNRVSDDTYWQDLGSQLMKTSQTQLPQQFILGYSPIQGLQSAFQILHYQTLQVDPKNKIERPYFLEPRLDIFGFKPNVGLTDLTFVGQYTKFIHPEKVEGNRVVLYPQVSLPYIDPGFQITPKFGFHLTKYALDNRIPGNVDTASRSIPTFTLDTNATFERDVALGEKNFIQTLEPRLYYVYIPYRNQSSIPVFDTALTDFNFAQIFSENRYSGYDRVNDANQLTLAVSSRMLDAQTGVELFKATVGQRYYFSPQRVALPGETVRVDEFSNVVAGATGLIAPKTYADTAWEYDYRNDQTIRFSAGARYQPDFGKVLSGSYRYTRDPLTGNSLIEQFDIAGQWPISAQWYAVGRHNFSMRDNRPLETIAGLEYNAGCWSARFVAQRLEAIAGSPNTTFFFQLELHDLGSIGSNPLDLLRRSIPGYGKMNELPGSTLTPVFPQ